MVHPTSRQLKSAATAILAVPTLILAAFAIGEVAAGDISGLQHVVEVALLALLTWLAWRQPRWGGAALVALALVLTALYVVFVHGFSLSAAILTVAFLFGAPALAGILFVLADGEGQRALPSGPGHPIA